MSKYLPHSWLFYGLLLGVTIVLFLLIQPFLSALVLAFTLAIVFQPVNNYLIKNLRNNKILASVLTLTLIALLVILPLFLFGWQIFEQGREFYIQNFTDTAEIEETELSQTADQIKTMIVNWLPALDFDYTQLQSDGMGWMLSNFSTIFANTIKIVLNVLIIFLALFYLLKDMPRFLLGLERISPLDKERHNEVMTKLFTTINSVVIGSLLIALLQGLAIALGFVVFGIPQPIFWGGIGVVVSLIPGIGPIVILLPASILLYLSGQVGASIGMIIWAILIVSLIDNLLRPILIERGIKIHPFLILLSALGGIGFFGPIGFVLGPIILSLFFALLDIYINYQDELINNQ